MRFGKRSNVFLRFQSLTASAIGAWLLSWCKRYGLTALGTIALSALFLLPPPNPFQLERIIGMVALAVAGVAMMRYHLREWHLELWRRPKVSLLLWLAAMLAFGGVQLNRFLLEARAADASIGFFTTAPIISAALLIGALLNPTAASSFTTLIALGCAATGLCDLRFAAASWLAGVVGAHAVSPLKHRSDLFKAGQVVLLLYAGGAAALGGVEGYSWSIIATSAGCASLASLGAVALFWFALTALERAFDLVTDWGLLELCSPEHPLLRELCTSAPGTYQHSIMVANLAEAAAQAIGANPLLTRVCAYYHDIGKLKRPDFFIENQGCANVHDKLSPSLSSMIISAHVKEGLEIAEEHHLPQPIKDAIAQHHGTSLITYFYHQATCNQETYDPVLEQHFRYPGPKPRSKEAALIMLADSIEAATRTLDRTSPARLEHFIFQLVDSRRSDGQLDDCDLTFRDLKKTIDSFVQTLSASRHQRIDYPEVIHDGIQTPERDRAAEPIETAHVLASPR